MPSVNAHMLTTGTPDLGADGKDYRANFVHAPFFEKSVRQASPCGCVVRRLPACDIARDMIPRGTAMNATSNPHTAAEQGRKSYRDVTTLDPAVPETVRAIVEKAVDQSREVYDRSKDALDASVTTLERAFDAAGQGAVAFNRKIFDIALRNVNFGFDLAKSLAGAKNLSEMVELQATYWRKHFGLLADQAEEVRALSTKVTADTAAPIKTQMARGGI
jgi:phasin